MKADKCGIVTVTDREGNVKRKQPPYTDAELKVILNGGEAHKNSVAEHIKKSPELLDLYHKNRMQYMEDYQVFMSQHSTKWEE